MLKAAEIWEGAQVTLTDPTVCTVAFSRGQERQVFFAVQGLPQVGQAGSAPSLACCAQEEYVKHSACLLYCPKADQACGGTLFGGESRGSGAWGVLAYHCCWPADQGISH